MYILVEVQGATPLASFFVDPLRLPSRQGEHVTDDSELRYLLPPRRPLRGAAMPPGGRPLALPPIAVLVLVEHARPRPEVEVGQLGDDALLVAVRKPRRRRRLGGVGLRPLQGGGAADLSAVEDVTRRDAQEGVAVVLVVVLQVGLPPRLLRPGGGVPG